MKLVATPNPIPAPRMAQNKSGSWWAEHVTIRPSARTISASRRLSMTKPCRAVRCPNPPPSVRPPIPVWFTTPPTAARP